MENGKICVATYNIWHGGRVLQDVGIIGRELSSLGADLVGLQEVDEKTERVGGLDTLRLIAEGGGYEYYAFARAMDYSGGAYGNAILSRYPILSFETVPLFAQGVEPRSVGHAVVEIDGVAIDFFNTHLSVEKRDVRLRQLVQLNELVSHFQNVILTGDFNTEEMQDLSLLSTLSSVNPRVYSSYYPGNTAIDHIFFTSAFTPIDVKMPMLPHSDHYPITARFSF